MIEMESETITFGKVPPVEMPIVELERAVLEAHAQSDGLLLAKLYAAAADHYERLSDVDAACFFLTQALVFALQEGADLAQTLHHPPTCIWARAAELTDPDERVKRHREDQS